MIHIGVPCVHLKQQTVYEVNCSPMRCIGVCQKCEKRSKICLLPVVDATPETMLMSASFPASQSQAAKQPTSRP